MLDDRSREGYGGRGAGSDGARGSAAARTRRVERSRSGGPTRPGAAGRGGARAGLWLSGALALSGCTHWAVRQQETSANLAEESRVLTTAVVDTLNAQPTTNRDEYSEVARRLATQDQRLEGLPEQPLPVRPLIKEERDTLAVAGDRQPGPARAALEERFEEQNRLITRARRAEGKLQTMGAQAEAERNARISRWTKWLSFGGLGLGGLVALMVLVPVCIPLLGRLLAWLAGKLPSLAGALGVVSLRAFDALVRGVERWKESSRQGSLSEAQRTAIEALETNLSREMDAEHKELVRARKGTAGSAWQRGPGQ